MSNILVINIDSFRTVELFGFNGFSEFPHLFWSNSSDPVLNHSLLVLSSTFWPKVWLQKSVVQMYSLNPEFAVDYYSVII